jgi:hypothetical protein
LSEARGSVVTVDDREVRLTGLTWSVLAFSILVAWATIDGLEIERLSERVIAQYQTEILPNVARLVDQGVFVRAARGIYVDP